MTNSYENLCDFLAIDPKNYSLTEFFTDLKLFCTFFSVENFNLIIFIYSVFFSRLVFKKFEYGVNKPHVQLKQRKYYLLKKKQNSIEKNKSRVRIRHTHFSQNLMSNSQYFVRTSSRRFPTRSDSTDDFLLAAAETGLSPSRCTSPSRRQVAFRLHDEACKIYR
jgi:hypothetical protein